jgi:succinate dehydrogenase / fumarate reductase, cytochrome b subunit
MYRTVGFWSWILRRVTGVAVAFYLLLHILVIHSITAGAASYDQVMTFLAAPLFKLGEIALLGAVFYHSLDGIRVLLTDFFGAAWYERRLFWGLMAFGIVLFTIAAAPLLVFTLQSL